VETVAVGQRAAGVQASVLNASGYVTARRRAIVSSKITGKVVEVNVEEGMAIREGQVLARREAADLPPSQCYGGQTGPSASHAAVPVANSGRSPDSR
jgi:hypothetical protein